MFSSTVRNQCHYATLFLGWSLNVCTLWGPIPKAGFMCTDFWHTVQFSRSGVRSVRVPSRAGAAFGLFAQGCGAPALWLACRPRAAGRVAVRCGDGEQYPRPLPMSTLPGGEVGGGGRGREVPPTNPSVPAGGTTTTSRLSFRTQGVRTVQCRQAPHPLQPFTGRISGLVRRKFGGKWRRGQVS